MKPIIFNSEMVRAILDGRKTVTRRVVKPQPENAHMVIGPSEGNDGIYEFMCGGRKGTMLADWTEVVKMPYHPGDVLYVRETWQNLSIIGKGFGYGYKADDKFSNIPWRSSIHMPKEAARIFLRVTDVRVEKLRDITEEQAIAEGCAGEFVGDGSSIGTGWSITSIDEFSVLWDSTIKPKDRALYGWDANPWIWVISFERISKKEAGA